MPNLYRCEINNSLKNFETRNKKEKQNSSSKKNKKLNFNICKKNTIKSLNDVENFLRNFNQLKKYLYLYKSFKK